jgi:uncharacterized protein YyaL (SSP411 family)
LAGESSPYLLQHAHNPVDWFPWGDEALRLSREQDRPILLSIGYSACHWCHVMERESFEDPDTARVMNELFVNIKVDREERPDLDQIYQTAIQILGRNGGWPLTIFLTPDLKPFFGGTYFPPVDRYGMRAFRRILEDVARAYRERRDQVDRQAAELAQVIGEIQETDGSSDALSKSSVADSSNALLRRFDSDHGGFGTQPKFPNSTGLELWLRHARANNAPEFQERVAFSVRKMIEGGIYDHLGGGFHRYSTDERWLIPHFEKMLYDNALLLRLLGQSFQVTADPLFANAARETASWVQREMLGADDLLYSTQDADSEGEEGRFFAWNEDEIRAVVPASDADLVIRAFGIEAGGNFEHGRSVLHRPLPNATLAKWFNRTPDSVEAALATAKRLLFEARRKRVPPATDDKALAGWNGLAIHGLTVAAVAMGEPLDLPIRLANGVQKHLVKDGRLLRTWRNGQAKIPAYAEDYAFLAEGELALFEATGDIVHLNRAKKIVDDALALFAEADGGFFLTAEGDVSLIQRPRSVYDNAVPSATSSMAMALLRLHAITGEGRYADVAEKTLRKYQAAMVKNPFGFSYFLCALEAATSGVGTLVITGVPGEGNRDALLSAARRRYAPNLVIVPWAPGSEPVPAIAGLVAGKPDETAAWLCRNGACSAPARSVEALENLLRA